MTHSIAICESHETEVCGRQVGACAGFKLMRRIAILSPLMSDIQPDHNQRKIIVCSFFTNDPYYSDHAEKLGLTLDELGLESVIQMIEKKPNEEWPDICRKKIPFLKSVCDDYPQHYVFWIDVDCRLISLPSIVAGSSADLIGFQRGFGSPMQIGYHQKSRFWEPCFFGISPSERGRAFINQAALLEQSMDIKATDDYFFEESWRRTNKDLSFQIISSSERWSMTNPAGFFKFGASGNVSEFKDKVEQHSTLWSKPKVGIFGRLLRKSYRKILAIERKLPRKARLFIHKSVRRTGLLELRRRQIEARSRSLGSINSAPTVARKRTASEWRKLQGWMLSAAFNGDREKFEIYSEKILSESAFPERFSIVEAGNSFLDWRTNGTGREIKLSWWSKPFPGNFGDWLSPYLISQATSRPVVYRSPTSANKSQVHLVGLGSIAKFANEHSIVVGTGVSSSDQIVNPNATFISVRGPITAKAIADLGGPAIESHGDPGLLMRRLYLPGGETKTDNVVFVRHFVHRGLDIEVPEHWVEPDVRRSSRNSINELIDLMWSSKGVVTSAMHVFIICQSYGIPCRLVTFRNFEDLVHGSGEKYLDYYLGSDQSGAFSPTVIGLDLRRSSIENELPEIRISDEVLDRIEKALLDAVIAYDHRVGE